MFGISILFTFWKSAFGKKEFEKSEFRKTEFGKYYKLAFRISKFGKSAFGVSKFGKSNWGFWSCTVSLLEGLPANFVLAILQLTFRLRTSTILTTYIIFLSHSNFPIIRITLAITVIIALFYSAAICVEQIYLTSVLTESPYIRRKFSIFLDEFLLYRKINVT